MITFRNNYFYGASNSPPVYSPVKTGKLTFDKLILVGSGSTNSMLNTAFDIAYKNNTANNFITQVNKILPYLYVNKSQQPSRIDMKSNYLMYGLPLSAEVTDGNTVLNVTKSGHIQISNSDLKDILVASDDLKSDEWKDSGFLSKAYNLIPGSKDLPIPKFIPIPGRSDMSNKDIISGGVRFLDPWPQSNWEKTSLGRSWPPDPYTTQGPLRLSADKYSQAVFLDTNHPSCLNVGKTYGISPRAIVAVNPVDSSVTLAVQLENNNDKSNISLAPWVIAPVKVPSDRKSIAAFPVKRDLANSLADSNPVSDMPSWLKSIKENQKWKIDEKNDLMIIDPSLSGDQTKLNTQNTNWTVYAIEGSERAIVTRSVYNHPDQFQIFVRGSANSAKSEYMELEYTGPLVMPGEKSTVVVKWDFVPVSLLSNGKFSKFGETGNMESEVVTVSKKLSEMVKKAPV
jgi:hypothetical protein